MAATTKDHRLGSSVGIYFLTVLEAEVSTGSGQREYSFLFMYSTILVVSSCRRDRRAQPVLKTVLAAELWLTAVPSPQACAPTVGCRVP